ncbi:MAG TPA: diguanylate cyclase [Thermodesulfovibrionales bacterium]|nr:diguanylate cyclase [Thermodesulfovibrionales bacterium]
MNERSSILIVDDDETLLPMLKEGFLLQGYSCETARDAETALNLVDKTPFDILVTDIVFPGMKGIELIEKARRLRPDMVTIIMTGFINKYTYDSAIEVGALDLIKKPFTLKELIARIEHAKTLKHLRDTSLIDQLTGLYNRLGFFTLTEHQIALAKREKRGLVMLYADMDDLKGINDRWGRQEGDRALIDAAIMLRATFRKSDIIARVGGDEFVALTIGAAGDDIDKIASRLRAHLENLNASKNRNYKLLISFCKLCFDPEGTRSLDELLSYGDTMMRKRES